MATKKFKLTKVNSSGGLDTLHPETEASQVTGLATVATSGSYNDLSNKPTIYDCNIQWGGNPIKADVSPIGTCLEPALSANRLAFMPGQQITIEYSTDGGTTWTDYGYSTDTKSSLFTFDLQHIPIGGNTDATLNHKTRVTLTAIESDTKRYTYFMAKKLLINVSTSVGLSVEIQTRTGTNYLAGNDTWASAGTYSLSGWPSWNDIPLNNLNVGGYAGSQNWQLRFIFNITAFTSMTSSYPLEKYVEGIKMFGPSAWLFPSTLAATNNIFSYDINKTVTFPSTLIATTFKKTNGTSSQFLKADGSVDSTAYSATSHTHTLSLATSSDTNVITLNHGTKYKLTAGGSSLVFTMPANYFVNYYHSTGSWSGLTYTATSNNSAPTLKFTIPTGTTSTTVAVGNHTHSNYASKTGGESGSSVVYHGDYIVWLTVSSSNWSAYGDATYSDAKSLGCSLDACQFIRVEDTAFPIGSTSGTTTSNIWLKQIVASEETYYNSDKDENMITKFYYFKGYGRADYGIGDVYEYILRWNSDTVEFTLTRTKITTASGTQLYRHRVSIQEEICNGGQIVFVSTDSTAVTSLSTLQNHITNYNKVVSNLKFVPAFMNGNGYLEFVVPENNTSSSVIVASSHCMITGASSSKLDLGSVGKLYFHWVSGTCVDTVTAL